MGTRAAGAFDAAVRRMDHATFRSLVNWIWETRGFETKVHGAASRAAIDITATQQGPGGETLGLRVIHRAPGEAVTREDIAYLAARDHPEDIDRIVVVTSGTFTAGARKLAAHHDYRLYDGDGLAAIAPPNVVAGLEGADEPDSGEEDPELRSDGDRLARTRDPVGVTVSSREAASAGAPVAVGAFAGAILYAVVAAVGVVTTGIPHEGLIIGLFGAAVIGRNLAPDDPLHPPIHAGLLAMLMLGSILIPLHIVFVGIAAHWAFLVGGVVYVVFVAASRAHPEFH